MLLQIGGDAMDEKDIEKKKEKIKKGFRVSGLPKGTTIIAVSYTHLTLPTTERV